MGINCAPLLSDLFLHAYKADIHQLLLMNIQCIYILAQTFHLQNELELRNVWRYQRTNQKPSIEERHTCNNMIKEKGQTDKQRFTKYYTENKRLSELNLKPGETQLLWKDKQFLLHMWHPSCYSCYKPGDRSWMRKGWWQTEHIRDYLWHRYSVTINYISSNFSSPLGTPSISRSLFVFRLMYK